MLSDQPVTIHLVTEANASLLDDMDDDVFDHPVTPDRLREFLGNRSNVLFVATIDTKVIGMVTGIAYVHPDKPRSLFINEVGVSGRYQRRGIGTKLVSAMLEWGRHQGCVEAWVAAMVSDSAARLFYEATGGVQEEQHAVVYTYPLDSIAIDP